LAVRGDRATIGSNGTTPRFPGNRTGILTRGTGSADAVHAVLAELVRAAARRSADLGATDLQCRVAYIIGPRAALSQATGAEPGTADTAGGTSAAWRQAAIPVIVASSAPAADAIAHRGTWWTTSDPVLANFVGGTARAATGYGWSSLLKLRAANALS
jgi:hypothetical protein